MSNGVSNLALFGIGELTKCWKPRPQARVSRLVQFFVSLQAAQDEDQLAEGIGLIRMRMIPIAF
jgi:hypothetical protein